MGICKVMKKNIKFSGTKNKYIKAKKDKKLFKDEYKKMGIEIGVCRIMNKFLNKNVIVRQEISTKIFADRQIKCIGDIVKFIKNEK